jgi:cytochrome oxidase Cu insertion factor (SCO1/SenC/PrrC family)
MKRTTKRFWAIFLTAGTLVGVGLLQLRRGPLTLVGKPAPTFSLPDQTGSAANLADQKGKWVVLQFYPMDGTHG